MRGRKHNKRKPLISERVEIQSDPFLRESPEVKSRVVSQLSAMLLKENRTNSNGNIQGLPGAKSTNVFQTFSIGSPGDST